MAALTDAGKHVEQFSGWCPAVIAIGLPRKFTILVNIITEIEIAFDRAIKYFPT